MSNFNRNEKSFITKIIALIVVLVVAVISWVICQFAVGSQKLNFPAILILFTVLFFGAGIVLIAFGVIEKSTAGVGFGSLSAVIGLVFLLSALRVLWYVTLIIAIALLVIAFLCLFLLRAKGLQIDFDNKRDDYKPYSQRKMENAEKSETDTEKELPKLKSFGDENKD